MVARAIPLFLAVLLLWPAADGVAPAGAKKKTQTITRTFSSDQIISIPNPSGGGTAGVAAPLPARINVKGLKKGKVKDVVLTLRGLSHSSPSDIDVILAKGSRSATVMSDSGSDHNISSLILTLDDEADAPLPDLTQILGGRSQPTNYGFQFNDDSMGPNAPAPNGNVALSTFNGVKPNGTWELFIRDDFVNEVGEITGGWSLEITAKVKKKGRK